MNTNEPTKQTPTANLAFRWYYIALPLIILLLSIVMTTYFYRLLPIEVVYHFRADGSPDRWLGRGVIILIALLPQLFFTLLGWAIIWGISKLATRFKELPSTLTRPESILSVMGNMVALPQVILFFAMLNIFSYNSYQIRFMPLWVFALIIMVLGGIILGIFFIRTMWHVFRTNFKER